MENQNKLNEEIVRKIMTQSQFENKWYCKKVKPTGHYNIPDKEYFVTACLLENNGAKFAIMATDYSLENKHWITFDLAPEEVEKLDERFEILDDYNNIDSEILFDFVDKVGDEILIKAKNFTNNVESSFIVLYTKLPGASKNDKLFDISWTSTTGEKLRKSYYLKKSEWKELTNQEIYDKFQNVRNWIRSGLYHFGDKF